MKYPQKTVNDLIAMYPEEHDLHKLLQTNDPGAWDIVSAKMVKLGKLFHSLSVSGYPGA
ncbi:MAG: hypothetical protein LWX02_09400 [Deltaproteobacteria bacterium]|jgi:hypothetical protein|nr:hypothetical protein [Deltaproteobacteria bacterium]